MNAQYVGEGNGSLLLPATYTITALSSLPITQLWINILRSSNSSSLSLFRCCFSGKASADWSHSLCYLTFRRWFIYMFSWWMLHPITFLWLSIMPQIWDPNSIKLFILNEIRSFAVVENYSFSWRLLRWRPLLLCIGNEIFACKEGLEVILQMCSFSLFKQKTFDPKGCHSEMILHWHVCHPRRMVNYKCFVWQSKWWLRLQIIFCLNLKSGTNWAKQSFPLGL